MQTDNQPRIPSSPLIGRRAFCGVATAFLSSGTLASLALGEDDVAKTDIQHKPGLIVRGVQPENYEFPFTELRDLITPTELFYVRTHFGIPRLDKKTWKLKIEGDVNQALELSLDQLHTFPLRKQIITLECAGNGRAFLTPKEPGVQWELGGVSTAEWEGIPLAAVLKHVGIKQDAVDVIFEGADRGEIKSEPKSPGSIHFARSLPIGQAKRAEVLLALRMNGKELTPEHGYPLRLVVPGWYGMASVKWLRRIAVTSRPFNGFFQSLNYTVFQEEQGIPTLVPITELQVKSEIARPAGNEAIPKGGLYRVHGAAWTGNGRVEKVEISMDSGKSWLACSLMGKAVPFSWRLWEYMWHVPGQPGSVKLMVRATDDRGGTQPMERDNKRRTSMISHIVPIEVTIT